MVGVDKNKLSGFFKKDKKEDEAKKTVVKKVEVKKATPRIVKRTGSASRKTTTGADDKIAAFREKKAASKTKKAEEAMHSKTHQDLINAAYKAAEELKIAPWVLLRAANWGHFTENRGKKYDGPMIDDIKTLDDEQKKALKKAIGL